MVKHPWCRHFKATRQKIPQRKIDSKKLNPELHNIIFWGEKFTDFFWASNPPRCCEIHLQFINDPCSRRRRMIRNPHPPWNLTSNDRQDHILCQHRMHQGAKNQPHGHHGGKVQTMARTSVPRSALSWTVERWICGPLQIWNHQKRFRHQKGLKKCSEKRQFSTSCDEEVSTKHFNLFASLGNFEIWMRNVSWAAMMRWWKTKTMTSHQHAKPDEIYSEPDWSRYARMDWTQTKRGVWGSVL